MDAHQDAAAASPEAAALCDPEDHAAGDHGSVSVASTPAAADEPQQHAEQSSLEIPCEFMLVGSVPRSAVFAEDSAVWEYEAAHDSSGGVVGVQSKQSATDALPVSPVDTASLATALRDCKARIEHNVMGSLLFKYMFRAPQHDTPGPEGRGEARHAFACFLSPKGQPLPYMGGKDGSVVVFAAQDPLQDDKVIAPGDPASTQYKPVVVALHPEVQLADSAVGIDATNVSVVDPASDPERTLIIFSICLDKGFRDMRVLYRGQSVVPIDNSGKPFAITSLPGDDGEALSLPEVATKLVGDSAAAGGGGHMGQRMLQVSSYYFAGGDPSSLFDDEASAADNVTTRIAATLSDMLQYNHSVRDAVVRQLYQKVGAHMFPLPPSADPAEANSDADSTKSNMKAAVAAARPGDAITLTVNMDHSYRVGIVGKAEQRSVTIKRIRVILDLV